MAQQTRSAVVIPMLLCLLPSFLYALFRFSIGVALPDISSEFGLSSGQAGTLISAALAAATATTGLAGYLSDRLGEKRVIMSGLLFYSTGLLGILGSREYGLFLGLTVLNGLGTGLMLPPTYSIVGRLAPRSRGLGTGALSGLYNIGGFVGPVLTSTLLVTSGWRTPFVVMGGAGALVTILVFFMLTAPPRDVRTREFHARRPSVVSLLRQRNILIVGAAILVADMAFLAFVSWSPTFMRKDLSMPPEQAGFFFGLAIAVGAVGVLSMGYLFDRIGGKRTTLLAASLSTALTFLFLVHPGGPLLAVVFLVLAGFVTNTFWSLLSALAQVSVDDSHTGTATGIIQNIGFLGAMIGPSLAGLLVSSLPVSSALIVAVCLPFSIYALLMTLYKE